MYTPDCVKSFRVAGRVPLDKSEGREGWEGPCSSYCPPDCSLPLGPEFSCGYWPSARSNTPHFSLILAAALKWSMACPPILVAGLAAVFVAAPARVGPELARQICWWAALWRVVPGACPPDLWRACPPALWQRARLYQAGRSSGLKLLGMSKCTARTQKNPPHKCLGMCALQSMRVSSPLESVFAKNLGGPPSVCQTVGIRERSVRARTRARALPPGAGCSTMELLEGLPARPLEGLPRRACPPGRGRAKPAADQRHRRFR
jgi:hypothetical protein